MSLTLSGSQEGFSKYIKKHSLQYYIIIPHYVCHLYIPIKKLKIEELYWLRSLETTQILEIKTIYCI